jgi:hypothetical protein
MRAEAMDPAVSGASAGGPKSGLRGRRRGRRFTSTGRLTALAIVVAILLATGGGIAFAYSSATRQINEVERVTITHLEQGQADLEAAKDALKQANATHDDKLIAKARQSFTDARDHFLAAGKAADDSALLRQAEGLPVVGAMARTRHQAVDNVSEMGVELAMAGLDLTDLDAQLIKPAGSGQQGQGLLAVVNTVATKTSSVKDKLQLALKAADRVDLTVLPVAQKGTLIKARNTIALALAGIVQFQALVPILTEVLGGNGTRNYLVEQLNPAELRPGGGFIGTYSVLRVDGGKLQLVASGNAADLIWPRVDLGQPGYVPPPAPMLQLIPTASWSFIDSNFYPDFPSNAQSAIRFAQPKLGMHIDAVIAIDYYTIAALLKVSGPVAVPGYHLTLTADNFISTVVTYDVAAVSDLSAVAVHKAILAAAAGPLLQHIVALPPPAWPSLIAALNDLASSRHLQVYFANAKVQDTMTDYGWSGVTKATGHDYVMEVEANLGATKANYFVTRQYTLELTRAGTVLHHKLTVDIADNMPYVERPHEYYKAYIRLFISDYSSNANSDLSAPHYRNLPNPPGTKLVDGWMLIHGYGHHRIVVFQWDTPWKANGRGEAQLYWQKQPGVSNDGVTVIWRDGGGHTYTAKGDLSGDRIVMFSSRGLSLVGGQVGNAQLPTLGLG